MKNKIVYLSVMFAFLFAMSSNAFAKYEGDNPPGWDKGNKTGWGGETTPPGQASDTTGTV